MKHNCATDDRKLPIDRPCSACSAGDTKMEHHSHCPPFREVPLCYANDRQVGGDHYRALGAALQHWDLVALTGMGYFEGQVTRYLARWRRKAGQQDLDKALHYADKLLELVKAGQYVYRSSCTVAGWAAFRRFALEQKLTRWEELAFELCINWTAAYDLEHLRRLIERGDRL